MNQFFIYLLVSFYSPYILQTNIIKMILKEVEVDNGRDGFI